jgi:hypothetical protein
MSVASGWTQRMPRGWISPCAPSLPSRSSCGVRTCTTPAFPITSKTLRYRVLLAFVLLAATLLNILFALRTKDALACYNLGIDTDKYDGAARRIAATGSVDVPILQPPGYILYLALLYRLLGPRVIVPKLLACAMILGLSGGVWALGRRFVGAGAAFAGAVLTITSPVLRAYASTLQYEILAASLFLASIAVVLAATHGGTRRQRFVSLGAASLLCGLTTLTRETFLVVFPVLLVYVALSTKGRMRERAEIVTMMAVIFVAVLGSWSVWQHRRTGQWVLVSQKGPLVLAFGNNPNANGTYNATLKPVVSPAGWEFIQERPWTAAKLAVRKFAYFFGFLKDGWNVPRASALLIARLTFGAVSLVVCEALARSATSVFALGGAALILGTSRLRRELWVLPAVIGATLGLHIVSISSHRFAIPVLPVLFLLAGIALATGTHWLLRRVSARMLWVGLLALTAWAGVAVACRLSAHARVEGEDLDGILADDVVDERASNGRARYADAARGQREMAVLTDEFLPKGGFRLTLELRADRAGDVGEVTMPIEGGSDACRETLRSSGRSGYERVIVDGMLPADASVKVIVTTKGVADVWLDRLYIEAGLRDGVKGDLFGNARVAELDFGSHGTWERWQREGWSGNERWGDELTFQWAVGTRSVLLVPLAEPCDLLLDLHVMPFAPLHAGAQQMRVVINGHLVGIITLGKGWRWYRVIVPQSNLRAGANTMELLHGRAIRPADVPGAGPDTRALAAAYDVLRITRR